MLKVAGFPRVVPLPARPGMNPQYLTEDRVIFAAFTAEGC
jgi:hypothetical protein